MGEALTPGEVWEVALPVLNFAARVRQIREYAADMRPAHVMLPKVLYSGENPITRRGLVARAELHQKGEPLWNALEDFNEAARLQQFGSVVVDARHRF